MDELIHVRLAPSPRCSSPSTDMTAVGTWRDGQYIPSCEVTVMARPGSDPAISRIESDALPPSHGGGYSSELR